MFPVADSTAIYMDISYHKEIRVLVTVVRYMKIHLLWPPEEMKISYCIKLGFLFACLGFIPAGCALNMYATSRADTGIDLSEDWSDIVSISVIFVVWLTCLMNQDGMVRMLHELNLIHNYETPMNLEDMERKLSVTCTILYSLLAMGICFYGIFAILESYNCEKHKNQHQFTVQKICGLFSPLWLPFDVDFFPVKQLIFLIQFLGAYIGIGGAALAALYCFIYNIHIVICLRHLKRMSRYISVGRSIDKRKFRRFVHYHQHIIRLVDTMNDTSSGPMCTHLLLTSTVLGVLTHRILSTSRGPAFGGIILFVSWLIALYMNSLGGQLILDESTALVTSLYRNVRWYSLDSDAKKDFLFIILRCQKPLLLHTGSFGYMSYSVFITVVKGLYYFTLLDIWMKIKKK